MGEVKVMKAPKVKIPKIEGMPKQPKIDDSVRLSAPAYILGLDVSLEHTGWSMFNVATGEALSGVFEPNPSASKKVPQKKGMERLVWLRAQIEHLAKTGYTLDMCQPIPTAPRIGVLVMIEGYAFGAKGASGINLGELGGVVRVALYDAKIPYIEIPPTQLKKFITGKGGALKEIMLKEVFKRYGFDTNDNNVADAYSLMQLGRAITNTNADALVVHQKEVVADVVKTFFKDRKLDAAA